MAGRATAAKPKAAAKRPSRVGKKVQFLQKPACTTCRKARKFMEKRGFELYFRDLGKNRLSVSELEKLIGKRDYTDFLNTRNEVYRKKKMSLKLPTRKEAVKMMAKEPNLIRRPVIVAGGRVVVGFDEDGIARL
jgi:Spx/MgsR family transcriptional regulator